MSRYSKIQYVLEPPDGGWGLMIVVAFTLSIAFTTGTFIGFALVYNDFLHENGNATSSTTLIHGVFGTVFALMGFATKQVLTKYSMRSVGIVGSLIYFIGALTSAFVEDIPQLVFTFGFLQGVGYGLVSPVNYTAMNRYFLRKRTIFNSIGQASISLLIMFMPMVFQYCMEEYGRKGTIVIIAALSLHTLLGAVIIQPVENHMVKRVVEFDTPKKYIEDLIRESQTRCSLTMLPSPQFPGRKSEENVSNPRQEKLELEQELSIKQQTFLNTIVNFLDLTLLKKFSYVNVVIGSALAYVTDLCVINITPLLLLNRGFTAQETALIVTGVSVGDFVSKIIQSCWNSFFPVKKNRYILLGGLISATILRFGFGLVSDKTLAIFIICGIGFGRGFIHVPIPVTIAEQCTQERFPAAYGLYMIAISIFNGLLIPIIAWLENAFHDDAITMSLLAILTGLSSVSWIIEMLFKKTKCLSKS